MKLKLKRRPPGPDGVPEPPASTAAPQPSPAPGAAVAAVPVERRAALLRRLPVFAALPALTLDELARGMEELRRPAGAVVVREGEAGDRLYLIAEGRVEVTAAGPRGGDAPLAVLGPGEMFGELALLDPAARRHATVTALTPLTLVALPRPAFEALLAAHPGLRAALDDTRRRLLTLRFLRVASPFAALSDEAARRLADRIERRAVPAGAVIVRQGERGDAAYLVASGRVEVVEAAAEGGGGERRAAELTAGALFGEAALLTEAPRCATVRAVEPTELLALGRADLIELMAHDQAAGAEVLRLLRLRERPRRAEGVEVFERATPEGEVLRILKNTRRGTYFRLSPRGWFVWQRLDGAHNLRELALAYFAAFKVFAPEQIAETVAGLAAAGCIETQALAPDVAERAARPPTAGERALRLARRVLTAHVMVTEGVDDAVARLYHGLGFRRLYTPAGQALLGALAVAGFAAFVATADRAAAALRAPGGGDLLWLLAPALLLALLAHEAGHALTVKAFGREVPRAGFGWYWFGPVAFADTSDMWLAGRWPRIAVSLAGVYVNILLAGAAALAVPLVGDSPAAVALLWHFALLSYGGVLVNLNPLLEYDGYHVLCDLIDRPNLRRRAMAWLGGGGFLARARRPGELARHWVELLYGVGSVLYVAVMAGLLIGVYRPILEGWLAGAAPAGVAAAAAWVVALLVAALLGLAIVAELRGAAQRRGGAGSVLP